MLAKSDERAVETVDLTRSFGWENNQAGEQHDIQELNRILFDIIERALKDTVYESLV